MFVPLIPNDPNLAPRSNREAQQSQHGGMHPLFRGMEMAHRRAFPLIGDLLEIGDLPGVVVALNPAIRWIY